MITKFFTSIFVALILLLHSSASYGMGDLPPHKYIPLRILVADNMSEVRVRARGAFSILDFETNRILREEEKSDRFTIYPNDITSEGIRIIPKKKRYIYVNNRQFRGEIDIVKKENGKLFVVNHVDLEEYLCGVLRHEVSHRWPMEILKAQAVAARTYALYQKLTSKNKYYEMTSNIYSQVYGGKTSETLRTRRAVNLTMGQVLTYEGKVFPSYYHATCGGRTSDSKSIWNIDAPFLGGRSCSFCKDSPHFKWKKELRKDFMQQKLQEAGHAIDLSSIEIIKRDEAGRILELIVRGKDRDVNLSGNKFRLIIGPNLIRSSNFETQDKDWFFVFTGKGWGHGIGMCQWGAYYMSKKNWKAEEILEYYYPGADITRLE